MTVSKKEGISVSQAADKATVYKELLPQVRNLLDCEIDLIANLANLAAVLKEAFGFLWVGFYLVKNDQLVLGPFQGSVACTRIPKGKGVCGRSWDMADTVVVPDVDQFEGHIACSSLSRSEIVVPLVKDGLVIGVLDIDSDRLNTFDEIDAHFLEKMVDMLLF
jgi:GAF domain-containing protein